ncbi:MAG: hypothetical protein K5871_08265 [Lachnospiraceae bacterium]|nr:hypothetical protein [Lachnospiraceae bacterium]
MNKKIKSIICAVIILAAACVVMVLVMNTESYRTGRLGKQLSEKYGVTFDLEPDEPDQVQFLRRHVYMLTSDEGIRSYAECDWKGRLISDSYAHYYYADEMVQNVESLIGSCFDECYIVRDCIEYGSNQSLNEFVSTDDSRSFEAYCGREPEVTVTYRVYVDYYVLTEQLQNALDLLSEQAVDYSVYFLRISHEALEVIRDAGLKCYYPNSGVTDVYMTEYKENHPSFLLWEDFESLVYEPFDVTAAEFIPKYDTAEICECFHERNREYFINVDKEHTYDEIISDIGYGNGCQGSGIITFIWKLNDGEAHIVFDSSGHIITIALSNEENDGYEWIYERYNDD